MILSRFSYKTWAASLCGFLLVSSTSCQKEQKTNELALVPMPNEIQVRSNQFTLTDETPVYVASELAATSQVDTLLSQLKHASGIDLTRQEYSSNSDTPSIGLIFSYNKELAAEAYKLNITPKCAIVEASTPNGAFYAIQTIRQLLPTAIFGKELQTDAVWSIPCLTVNDAPRFEYRGVMIDVARHFFSIDEMKKIIDVMALHKLNTLHWHLTDDQGWRIEIKKYPKLTEIGSIRPKTMIRKEWDNYDTTPYGGFYTQEEIRDFVKYAESRCINIVPEIDLPGHMQAALASYPELGCTGGPYEVSGQWGVRDDVLCPGKEMTFEFIEGVLTEVMELFPYKYIHIGGDECPKIRWEKCPKCQARIKAENIKGDDKHSAEFFLQSYTMARVEKFLNEHGRAIIGWDEILEGEVAPNATVMSWRGMDGGIEAARLHHPVIMTPNTYLYFDYYATLNTKDEPLAIGGYNPIDRVYSLDPVPAVLNDEEKKYIIGVQANLWTEYIPSNEQLEYMLLPRMAALSEVQWTETANKSWERFQNTLEKITNIYNVMGLNYDKHIFEISASYDVTEGKNAVIVSLDTQGNAPIFYTTDGTDPTEQSNRYNAPIEIKQSCTLKAIVKREGMQTRMFTQEFKFNKATGKLAKLNSKPTEKYTFKGAPILTDGLRGEFNYSSGYWLGFMNEPMDVTIDFGKTEQVSSVKIGAMMQYGEWVFPPSKITVWTAEKNGEFIKRGETIVPETNEQSKDGIDNFECTFDQVNADQIRILVETVSVIPQWHGARGLKGHMFIDEIIVE